MPSTAVYFVLPAPHGGDRRLLDVLGRVEIRFARRQPDDVAARRFQLDRLVGDRDGGRGLDARERVGEEGHPVVSGWEGRRITAAGAGVLEPTPASGKR